MPRPITSQKTCFNWQGVRVISFMINVKNLKKYGVNIRGSISLYCLTLFRVEINWKKLTDEYYEENMHIFRHLDIDLWSITIGFDQVWQAIIACIRSAGILFTDRQRHRHRNTDTISFKPKYICDALFLLGMHEKFMLMFFSLLNIKLGSHDGRKISDVSRQTKVKT